MSASWQWAKANPDAAARRIRELERENAALQKTITNCNADWAEDHTHLQNLCIQAGISSAAVNGDSYGVPGIIELAEMLAKELQFLRSQNTRWHLETSIINDILDGEYDPISTDFDYETPLTDRIQKMMQNKS